MKRLSFSITVAVTLLNTFQCLYSFADYDKSCEKRLTMAQLAKSGTPVSINLSGINLIAPPGADSLHVFNSCSLMLKNQTQQATRLSAQSMQAKVSLTHFHITEGINQTLKSYFWDSSAQIDFPVNDPSGTFKGLRCDGINGASTLADLQDASANQVSLESQMPICVVKDQGPSVPAAAGSSTSESQAGSAK